MAATSTTTRERPGKQRLKRNAVLRLIRRQGRAARLPLAKALGISNSRVCSIVDEMVKEGLLIENRADGGDRRGRRGVSVGVNPSHGYIVGFDMEAQRMRLVLTDFAGRKVWEDHKRLEPSASRQGLIDEVLDFIQRGYEKVIAKYPEPMGIGLASPGLHDIRHGTILHYDLIDVCRDIPLRDLVASRLRRPCVLEDNIRALTLAEWNQGAGRPYESFICFAVRSGVGMGVVVEGRLHVGAHGFAGEVGYLPVPHGLRGGWGHLHQQASESALGIDVEEDPWSLTDAKARRVGELLGAQLVAVVTILDPQAVVLTGGLVKPDGPLWSPVLETFRKLVLPELAERVQIEPAQLGPFAAAVGAAQRCFQSLYPVEASDLAWSV